MHKVQAKFYVGAINPNESGTASTVHLNAVCRGAANRGWCSATPGGSIQMTVRNEVAVDQFVVGEEYLLTFEHAPKPELGDGHAPEPMPAAYPQTTDTGGVICGRCGVYAGGHDGEALDWSNHEKLYAQPAAQPA